ncbi:prepilin-type N-terminal cleavage/methylation domain-containing protein [Kineococcus sp. LSe6-4]|uniref:Prepilin-type N-terminal cleavage/methylation domain-containing protein n=1 Tax=Kineococcus halophytocola TaxID=3234027 RepID=A0ABV4GZQ4_9ACTN
MDARHDEDAGFTLLETIISMVIFALVAVATAGVIVKSVALTADNRGRAVASKIAAQQVDTIRSAGYSDIVSATSTVTASGTSYSVNTIVTPVFDDGSGGKRSCAAGGVGGQLYKKVGVTVSWQNNSQVKAIRNDTIVQNPGTSTDATKGAVAVTVTDSGVGKAAPEPVGQQVVTLSTGESALTDDDGCAFFDNLAPMTSRTISVSQPGWIDNLNQSPATTTVGVTAGLVSSRSISFDKATTLNLSFAPAGQAVGTYAIPVFGNAVTSSPARYTVVPQLSVNDVTKRTYKALPSTSATGASSTWWPQDSGYSVWFGSCTQDPASPPTALADTLPGKAVTATVPTGGLDLTIVPAATPRTLYFQNTASGCQSSPETYKVTIAANQTSAKVALPFGTWKAGFLLTTLDSGTTLTAASPVKAVTK